MSSGADRRTRLRVRTAGQAHLAWNAAQALGPWRAPGPGQKIRAIYWVSRTGGCAVGAASALPADGRDSRDGTVGGDFFKRARSLTANRGNFAAFKQRGGHRQLPISAPGPAGFVDRFDALIAIIDYSGSCSPLPADGPFWGDDSARRGPSPDAVQASRHRSGVVIFITRAPANFAAVQHRPRQPAPGFRCGGRRAIWASQGRTWWVEHGDWAAPHRSRAGTDPAATVQIQQVLQLHLVRRMAGGRQSRQQRGELSNQRHQGRRSNPLREAVVNAPSDPRRSTVCLPAREGGLPREQERH
jgi:hypothetical protein